ncbi:Electron transport complex, RnfABCDGE type, G subunit [[Clostridium] ultunense Esp]|uniref:Ion-translocating oxidoreductase complex subunit G n=1 Tax=[Clostridium] ultunense Esp TaxID=1288971 RepID=M1Z6D3_9FIRM|nr:RnfABCDGE type electron transport complex subunit G [Schnuerera ultunensis]CCQ98380.1 Electron transport complex, RnfABCDGE type, G subunit [[Clostridium] ultunense Esp]SHD77958.1 Electron transport complex, RnfABCDGE type, G subunit [[Clostridium] ultunense Esp]
MNETLKLGLILFIITAVAASVLAVSNSVTSERIAEADRLANERAKMEVLDIAEEFNTIDEGRLKDIIGSNTNIVEINEGYKDSDLVGYTFNMKVNGYGGEITFMTGVSKEGKITGLKILNHGETPGLGANSTKPYFSNSFKDKSVDNELTATKSPQGDSEVQALTSATITTNAIVDGVNIVRQVYNEKLSN